MLVRMLKCLLNRGGNIARYHQHHKGATGQYAGAIGALRCGWGDAAQRQAGNTSYPNANSPNSRRTRSALHAGNAEFSDESQEEDITNHPAYPRAMARAMRLINYRERSAHELCKRLQEDQYPPELVEAVLSKVQHMGLQDDARFAEMFAWGRWRAKSLSPNRIKHELEQQHHVGREAVDSALAAVFGYDGRLAPSEGHFEEEEGEHSGQSTSSPPDAWTLLMAKAQRHAESSCGQPAEKRKAKMVRWLQYRGHSWDTVKRVLKELEL